MLLLLHHFAAAFTVKRTIPCSFHQDNPSKALFCLGLVWYEAEKHLQFLDLSILRWFGHSSHQSVLSKEIKAFQRLSLRNLGAYACFFSFAFHLRLH